MKSGIRNGRFGGAARRNVIKPLEDALALADELNAGGTGYLIECTLDEARAQPFKPFNLSLEPKWVALLLCRDPYRRTYWRATPCPR